MKPDMKTVITNDFLAFARKAISELEGIKLSRDRYLEVEASELMNLPMAPPNACSLTWRRGMARVCWHRSPFRHGSWPTNQI
jgi:hypothetical protein